MVELCPPHGEEDQIKRQKLEEILEQIWTLREEGKTRVSDILSVTLEADPRSLLDHLVREGHLKMAGDEVALTKAGDEWGRGIVRRFRLSRRLLVDVFDLGDQEATRQACEFEHILSPQVTDSVCTFLGHPTTAPDGKPIPRGDCCAKYRLDLKPLVSRLSDLAPGEAGRVAFMTPGFTSRLPKLGAMGLVPGSTVRPVQKQPSIVLEIGETTLAVDEEIAKEIFVKRVNG